MISEYRIASLMRIVMTAGLAVSVVLLVRFALDFSSRFGLLLSSAFWLLVVASLSVAAFNIFSRAGDMPTGESVRGFLLLAIPAGFIASSLDCIGLTLEGCSSFCTFVKLAWIPAIGLLSLAAYFRPSRGLELSILACCFVPLIPHCVCYNVGNAWWIDRIGSSPVCYAWGFTVALISISAGRTGAPRLSLTMAGTIIAGALAFFVGHHFFDFPW